MIHWSIIFLGLIVGILIGAEIESYIWRSVAKGDPGHHHKGSVYHVLEEGDDHKWRMWITIRGNLEARSSLNLALQQKIRDMRTEEVS